MGISHIMLITIPLTDQDTARDFSIQDPDGNGVMIVKESKD